MNGTIGFEGILTGDIEAGGGSGVTPHVTATASVDANTGTPTVTVIRSGPDAAPNFDFAFQNLKGEKGDTGSQGIQGIPGPAGSPGSQGPRGFTGNTGERGPQGDPGITPVMTASATVDDTSGTPTVVVTRSGTDAAPHYDFDFHNLKGQPGSPGETGSQGPEGPAGPAGVGVPVGGTVGQYLTKTGSADYLTGWSNLPEVAAEDVTFDIDNCQIVTSTNLQGAVEELDGAVDTLNSNLAQSNWQSFGSGDSVYRHLNGITFVKIYNVAVTARAWTTVGTLPVEYRPSVEVNAPVAGGSYREYSGIVQIATDGTVRVYANTSASYWGFVALA